MKLGLRRSTRLLVVAMMAASAVVPGIVSVDPAGAQTAGPIDCPTVMPVAALQKGMTGTGWTVIEGTTPQSFGVLVKGVLPDGMGPGRDLIIVQISGPIVDEYGGAWFGMSGSPVYINGQLIGAVSAALAWGPSDTVGLTPGEDMARLLDYPHNPEDDAAPTESSALDRDVQMTQRDVASMAPRSADGSTTSFVRMKLPLSVSGASPRALAKLSRTIAREEAPFIPYSGGSSTMQAQTQPAALHAGGNFAAAMSYGDLTMAAVATTTMVCNGEAVAFGHPFFWSGATKMGANDATSLAIVKDPVFGSYKLAVVGDNAGTVDQDRLAGLRALLGTSPERIPITSTVTAPSTGNARDGQTDALLSEMVPFLAPYHVFSNILVTLDRWGEGSSDVSWSVTGTTSSGEPFQLTRTNMFASEWGIEWESVSEMERFLYQMYRNGFEEITFDSVDADVVAHDEVRRLTITDVAVSVNGGEYVTRKRVRARRGDVLNLRVTLTPYDESEDRIVEMSVRIPERARTDGLLEIAGGGGRRAAMCFYRVQACLRGTGEKVDSFQELLAALQALPRSNELRAELRMGRRGKVRGEDLEVLDQVVSRARRIRVMIAGSTCCFGDAEEPRRAHRVD